MVRKFIKSRKGNNSKSFFSLTSIIIFINVILFFVFTIFFAINPSSVNQVAITPSSFVNFDSPWTLITSMFMHANGFHLLVNMFTLFFLGTFSEKIIGRKRFLWLYLISGIIAGLAFVFFAYIGSFFSFGENVFGAMSDSAVGASGALFGLLGLLAVLIPWHSVYLIAGPLIVVILQFILGPLLPASAGNVFYMATTFLIFFMIFAMFSSNSKFRKLALPVKMPLWLAPVIAIVPLVAISFFVKLPIGNTAHFGGLVVGLVYGFYLRKKYKNKIRLLRRYIR